MSNDGDKSREPPRRKPGLLGILRFLLRYPVQAGISIGLLLVNIGIEMSLPQIIGRAINQYKLQLEGQAKVDVRTYVVIFVGLVIVRAAVGFVLGPIRN